MRNCNRRVSVPLDHSKPEGDFERGFIALIQGSDRGVDRDATAGHMRGEPPPQSWDSRLE